MGTFLGYYGLEFSLTYAFMGRSIFFYMGYFIDKFFDSKKEKIGIYILGIISFIVTLILLKYNKSTNIWSFSPTYIFISIMIYIFIRDFIKLNRIEKVVLFVGKYSLSVYMLHMIFIYTFNDIVPKDEINSIVYAIIIIVLSCISSLICGFVLDNTIIKALKTIADKLFGYCNKIYKKIKE